MKLSLHIERWPAITPFRITGRVWETFESIVIEVEEDGKIGRGEALGVFYLQEDTLSMVAQIEALAERIKRGISRSVLQTLLPPGGARNALDCALWDLEAKTTGRRIWELLGLDPKPLETVLTLGIEATPELMAAKAAAATAYTLLKIKLDAHQPLERIRAIRAARPDARIVIDANQAWTLAELQSLAPTLAELDVTMVEQPLARGADAGLEGCRLPVRLCADESCLHLGDLEVAARRYQMINIKLDKTGGLTHAIELARAARARGLGLMVGCMAGSSLAMAPAAALGWSCDLVDIDGPLLQKWDRLPGLSYAGGRVAVYGPEVWG